MSKKFKIFSGVSLRSLAFVFAGFFVFFLFAAFSLFAYNKLSAQNATDKSARNTANGGSELSESAERSDAAEAETLLGTEFFLSDRSGLQSQVSVVPAADFSISEAFAGQGGYDVSAGLYGGSRNLQSFLPAPAVWAQAVQNAGVYPELTYTSYRIRKGDMIGVIAERFGLTQDTLISINNIRQTRRIQIGEYIKVPSMPGILYTTKKDGETAASVAEKYQVSAQKTAAVNHLHEQGSLAAGTSLFVPDAFMDWVTRQEINGDLFRRPLRARYYVSSSFGWRRSPFTGKRTFHNGVDMASPAWTPVYAALAGTVTAAGFHSVYGNYVIVAHHSGYRTLYGHMVGIKARKGQSVDTRTVLGWVGTTGLSTGPHLHFSVFKYGSAVNPVSLWN